MTTIRKVTFAGAVQGLATESLPDDLIEQLQWDMPGTILKRGSRSTVTQTDLQALPIVIKQYKTLALHRRLRYALTRSRARQNWETGQAMADLGLPIVRPLGFFEETNFRIPRRALLIAPFQKGITLDQYHAPDTLAPKLREIFQTMAKNRITHGDLKATNIIIDQEGRPHFIDNDDASLHHSQRRYEKARQKDERQFLRNWESDPALHDLFRNLFR